MEYLQQNMSDIFDVVAAFVRSYHLIEYLGVMSYYIKIG